MNKKTTIPIISENTPKGNSRSIRTLSNNSSSSSIKGKINGAIRKPIGKENLQSNLLSQDSKIHNNENININPLKGLKRIKQKAQGQAVKPIQRYKIPTPNKLLDKQKTSTQNHTNKSLLTQKMVKQQNSSTDKKLTPLKSEKSATPKSMPKKSLLSKKQLIKKSQYECQASLNQIITQTSINCTQSQQIFTPESTPKPLKQQINMQCLSMKSNQKQIATQNKQQSKKELMISMFQIRNKLYESSFSTTFEVIHIQTGLIFCLKVFQKLKIKQQGLQQQLITEIKFRKNLNNKNIQKLWTIFDDQVYIYFVEQYLIGFDVIEKQLHLKRRFSQKQAGTLFKQVFEIVRFIHSQNYIHRDIRLHNLVRCFGVIKLIDFSWVACLRYKKQRDTFCGTYKYAPPELLQGQNYDQSIDIWSLGILLYQLTTGQSPFNEGFTKRNSHSMNFPIFLSNQLVDLIGRLLSDKGIRMRIQQILMHQWTNKWQIDGFVCKQIWDFWVL